MIAVEVQQFIWMNCAVSGEELAVIWVRPLAC